jgi:hypothetical protein
VVTTSDVFESSVFFWHGLMTGSPERPGATFTISSDVTTNDVREVNGQYADDGGTGRVVVKIPRTGPATLQVRSTGGEVDVANLALHTCSVDS